jgi:carbamoyl-phosphate synthase large subunit
MRSTGEVMGMDKDLGVAFLKAFYGAGMKLPKHGRILITVKSEHKRSIVPEAQLLLHMGYELVATEGTYRALRANGIECERVNKVQEGRPHIVDLIKNREIDLVLNTPYGMQQRRDDGKIRAAAIEASIPCATTRAGISAVISALSALHRGDYEVHCLQTFTAENATSNSRSKATQTL